jgi:hypothetical protein
MHLLPHPDSAPGPVRQFDGTAGYGADGALQIAWSLRGDLSRLRIPPPLATPRVADELWRHTCFEAFVADPHSSGYVELNFSPSGEWAAYGFRSYRTGMAPLPLKSIPDARWHRESDSLTLAVNFRMDSLPGPPGPRPPVALRVGLAAVLEGNGGELTYWALGHPPGKPDFHHADAFLLQVVP